LAGLAVIATAVAAVLLKLAAIQLAEQSANQLQLGLAHLVRPDEGEEHKNQGREREYQQMIEKLHNTLSAALARGERRRRR